MMRCTAKTVGLQMSEKYFPKVVLMALFQKFWTFHLKTTMWHFRTRSFCLLAPLKFSGVPVQAAVDVLKELELAAPFGMTVFPPGYHPPAASVH